MKPIISFLISIILFYPICAQVEQNNFSESDQIEIYNSLIGEIFEMGMCTGFITPPFYACCNNNEHMAVEDHVACCEESDILPQYKIYCQNCINIGELDTLELVMEVIDTLYPLDFEEYRDYILDELDTTVDASFYNFISTGFFNQPKMSFDKSRLNHAVTEVVIKNRDDKPGDFAREKITAKKINFHTHSEIEGLSSKGTFGKKGKNLFLGKLDLSLVYFNKEGNLAFFYYAYLGNNTCGGLHVFLAEKAEDGWSIIQEIDLGSF